MAAFRVEAAEDGQPEIHVISRDKHEPPYCMVYFADLRSWPLDEALPQDCVPLLADYLEALIALPNTQRERHAYFAGWYEPECLRAAVCPGSSDADR